MGRFGLRPLILLAVPATAGVIVGACARKATPAPNPMTDPPVCDTTPMKPLGRRVEIPAITPRPNQAALTGSVVQAETGDAIVAAAISLRPVKPTPKPVEPHRYSNPEGGFSFDDLDPGAYRVLVRRIGESLDTATIQLVAGRVDTLSFRLRAYRCYGY